MSDEQQERPKRRPSIYHFVAAHSDDAEQEQPGSRILEGLVAFHPDDEAQHARS